MPFATSKLIPSLALALLKPVSGAVAFDAGVVRLVVVDEVLVVEVVVDVVGIVLVVVVLVALSVTFGTVKVAGLTTAMPLYMASATNNNGNIAAKNLGFISLPE